MPIYANINGNSKSISKLYDNINAAKKANSAAYANINNSSKKIFPEEEQLVRLSELTPGRIISFDTTLSGTNKSTDFIVLGPSKQGDTILCLQRYVYYDKRIFDSASGTGVIYKSSSIDSYLSADITQTSSYRSLLSEIARNCLVATTITVYSYGFSVPGMGYDIPASTDNISRDIFLMSYTEAGFEDSTLSVEGNSYLNALKIAAKTTVDNDARKVTPESGYFNTINTNTWWLRSQSDDAIGVRVISCKNGTCSSDSPTNQLFVRPILSFNPDTIVNNAPSTAILIGK